MTVRTPPRIAMRLLQHLGPNYRSESLAGDLYEEFQQHRTHFWFWRQVIAAICIGQTMKLRRMVVRMTAFFAPALRALFLRRLLPRLTASTLVRLSTEGAAVLGAIALSEQVRHACSLGTIADIPSIVALIGAIGLCVSVGFYLSLSLAPTLRRAAASRRGVPIKRLLSVFAVTALSAGTLTWASETSHLPQHCTHQGNSAIVSPSYASPGHTRGN